MGAPLRKPFEGQWRARRGEFGVRHRIDDEARTVYVLDIDRRGEGVGVGARVYDHRWMQPTGGIVPRAARAAKV
ncbi:MAG: hypothetical protein KGQ66_09565 [Acidobacteriota bacterium]|nr:hypothetical protein [Acidobacteriota bacterium]